MEEVTRRRTRGGGGGGGLPPRHGPPGLVTVSESQTISRQELLRSLDTYNLYLRDRKALHLTCHVDGDHVLVQGALPVTWALTRPIRLQLSDDLRSPTWLALPPAANSGRMSKGSRGMVRWDGFSDLNTVGEAPEAAAAAALTPPGPPRVPDPGPDADLGALLRTRSDAGVLRRQKGGRRRKGCPPVSPGVEEHRVSINGHFYNHQTAVFTPEFGCVTNVVISSDLTSEHVMLLLLQKFRIENAAHDFCFVLQHSTGERRRLAPSERPLLAQLLQGPDERVARILIVEAVTHRDVTHQEAQFLGLDLPLLLVLVQRLEKEEEEAVERVRQRYRELRSSIRRKMSSIRRMETSV
ncbi:ras association domain-containing protein 2-like [Petromyzon marinus]|uniref:ras association domain-containing protein 2-like n=1 Tax=Petromyzon marinus TaxID=7757 RepID=UPI003F6F418C